MHNETEQISSMLPTFLGTDRFITSSVDVNELPTAANYTYLKITVLL